MIPDSSGSLLQREDDALAAEDTAEEANVGVGLQGPGCRLNAYLHAHTTQITKNGPERATELHIEKELRPQRPQNDVP